MSRIIGWLYATGVCVLVLGGVAVVLALTAGHSQARLPVWMCGVGAVLLLPEVLRKGQQVRNQRTEAKRLHQDARMQRAASLAADEQARRTEAQSSFDRFVAEASDALTPLPAPPTRRLSLAMGEHCYAWAESAAHVTTRKPLPASHLVRPADRPHDRTIDRPTVRIDAGIRYEIDAGQRNPLADHTERIADRGALGVTNRRIVFDGAREMLNIPLEKILQVHLDGNRIILLVQQQFHPVIFYVGDRYRAPVMAAAIFRLAQETQEAKPAEVAVDGDRR